MNSLTRCLCLQIADAWSIPPQIPQNTSPSLAVPAPLPRYISKMELRYIPVRAHCRPVVIHLTTNPTLPMVVVHQRVCMQLLVSDDPLDHYRLVFELRTKMLVGAHWRPVVIKLTTNHTMSSCHSSCHNLQSKLQQIFLVLPPFH